MKKVLLLYLLFLSHLTFSQEKSLYSTSQQNKQQAISLEISTQEDNNYQKALASAKAKNWPISGVYKDGRVYSLKGLDATGQPLYLITHSNARAAAATRTTSMYTGGSLGLSLNGNSSYMSGKLGIWDGGRVYSSHVELTGRVTQQDNATTFDQHATHTSGTMIATGISAQAKGMSFGANLRAWDYNSDNTEISNAASSLLISNHSYGYLAGWNYDSDVSKWRWMGNVNINAFEDYKFGFYDSNTQTLDKIAYNAPYYLIVKSAGNNRGETGPDAGTVYYLGNTTDTSSVIRSKNDSYDILPTTSTAKNILTVGAVNALDTAPTKPSDIKISDFSSWGPTDDGRIKPDIVGVGVNLFSTSTGSTTSYATLSGTSMSSPQVAGSLFLLQELYAKQNDGQFMRSATLRGLAIHTAEDAGNVGPDYIYGWGLLNMEKAGKVILNTSKSNLLQEKSLAQGSTSTQTVVASGQEPLRVSIVWTDPEGTITSTSASNLNNRTPKLVNDLDIRVSDGTSNYLPFTLNPEKPSELATTGDNIRDNIEQILISNPLPGATYTITVSHKGTLTNSKQDFSLIVSGVGTVTYCNNTVSSGSDVIESASLAGGNNVSTNQAVTLNVSVKNTSNHILKAFIDWNSNGSFDDDGELVGTSTVNGTGAYALNFTAPQTINYGTTLRMRVICSQAASASAVTACGSVSNAEVIDIPLTVTRALNDIAVTNLVTPETGLFCSNTALTQIKVSLTNNGLNSLSNIPVSVTVSNTSGVSGTFTGTYTGTLASLGMGEVTLTGTMNVVAGQSYNFVTQATLASDQDSRNNQATFTRIVSTTAAPTAEAIVCDGASTAIIKSASSASVQWFDQSAGGTLIYTGGTGSFTLPTGTSKLYVSTGEISGNIGAKTKYEYGDGSYYEFFGPAIIMTTQAPILLKTARIYVGTPGNITFSVVNAADGAPVSSVTIPVQATRTTANTTRSNSQLIDDKTDQGVVVNLNLKLPAAGTYYITQECTDGASIYRSNKNLTSTATDLVGYPFSLNNTVSITGAYYNGSTIKTGYYYLYDINVGALECPSVRAAVSIQSVTAPTVSVTPASTINFCPDGAGTLTATLGNGYTYQWYRNGATLNGATSNTLNVSIVGSYTVKVSNGGACTVTTPSVTATTFTPITPTINWTNGVLSVLTGTNPTWTLNGLEYTTAKGLVSFTPIQSGFYNAKVTDANGCSAYSAGISVTITAIEEDLLSDGQSKVYPNPTSGIVTVKAPDNNYKAVTAEVVSLVGNTMTQKSMERIGNDFWTSLDLSQYTSGQYFIRVYTDAGTRVLKVALQK